MRKSTTYCADKVQQSKLSDSLYPRSKWLLLDFTHIFFRIQRELVNRTHLFKHLHTEESEEYGMTEELYCDTQSKQMPDGKHISSENCQDSANID
jgi:hypothetical protein